MFYYKNGNYTVIINQDNGTKIRYNNTNNFVPSFAESCDITITTKCDNECSYCYLNCNKNGQHANLKNYKKLIKSLHPYTEVAINGNDLTHPDLEWFLYELKKYSIFPNITVNQYHFIKNIDYLKILQKKKLIYGIGLSYTNYDNQLFKYLKMVRNVVLHTINGVTKPTDYLELLEKRPESKILILGYKQIGRGNFYKQKYTNEIQKNQKWLNNNIKKLIKEFFVVSFDNLALSQLDIKNKVDKDTWEKNYMGDEGKYTFYIDLVHNTYALNSFSKKQYKINKQDVDYLFKNI